MRGKIARFLRAPLDDYMAGLDSLMPGASWWTPALVLVAAAMSWWVYVPIHELAHAVGCLATGGEVTRLEIDAIYGAAWLQKMFPYVVVGSDYAGQLTGFDTHGSDLVYLATDLTPFLLTIIIGVPLLRKAATLRHSAGALAFGAAIPVAFAPFISLTGDFFEIGSIVVSRLVAVLGGPPVERWRSDDAFLLVSRLVDTDGGWLDWTAITAAALVGLFAALALYAAGGVFSSLIGVDVAGDRVVDGNGR